MRPHLITLAVAATLALCALLAPAPAVSAGAEDALRALAAQSGVVTRVGAQYWYENEGFASRLAPAPLVPEKGLCMLGSETPPNRPASSLWRLDERGVEPLRVKLKANVQRERDYANNTNNGIRVEGKSHEMTLENGARGLLTAFALGVRSLALVVTSPGGASEDLYDWRDDLMADLWPVILPENGLLVPLLMDGRYACRLPEFARNGLRFHKRAPRGYISARVFVIAGKEFASRDLLQIELEERLKRQGLKRSGGVTLPVAGTEAYCGEYFTPGSIERILFAQLGEDYLVALFHGHESSRDTLRRDAEWFAASITPTGLTVRGGEKPWRTIAEISRMEIMAWQEGQALLWGALFDKPWRESGVRFEAKLTQNGKVLAQASGEAQSSVDFNPLPSPRRLNLPSDAAGEALFEAKVGGLSESMRVHLR
jgi:hypothetical protein